MVTQKFLLKCLLAFSVVLLSACATRFPSPQLDIADNQSPTAAAIFQRTFKQHGGDQLEQLDDVNLAISGEWKGLIKRIQPLVSDFNYRVDSQERLFPNNGGYVALFNGPNGTKKVIRTPDSLEVYYNNEISKDPEVLSSTALTADAFHLFLLGPLTLQKWQDNFVRLSDSKENGLDYYRLYLKRSPGFGYSASDEVVLWIDKLTDRTFKVQITLQGHSTTQGAHVEVDYLDYIQLDEYLFPSVFFERVNAPIAIDAHAWRLTGIDINRGNEIQDYRGPNSDSVMNSPAKPFQIND